MFALYLSKDVLFSCALVMLVMSLSDLDGGNSAKGFVRLSIFALLTMLLRNNGLLIVAVLAVVLPLAYRNSWKKAIMATLIPIAIFIGFRTVSYSVLDIERESFAESASIPLQQVGYVLANSDTSMIAREDLEFLDRIMPISRVKEVYDLGYTDEYKFDAYFDDGFFNDHSKEFMGVWLRMLPNYFPEYVMSYLGQTLGYWHYGESNTLCTQGVWEDNTVSIERMDVIDRTLGFSLYTLIEKLMLGVRKAPLLNILTSMAMQFMAILLLGGIYIRNRNYGRLVVILPLLILWVSIMIATPAFCLFRYTYPMFMLWPVTAIWELRMRVKAYFMKKTIIVMPVANEEATMAGLIEEILALPYDNLYLYPVVDDYSKDGTADIIRSYENTGRVKLIYYKESRGVITCYLEGFRRALADGAERIIEMDGGGSHKPSEIPQFIENLDKGYDCVWGSRFVEGGGISSQPLYRRILSSGGTILANVVLGTRLKDMTSGFEGFQAPVLRKLKLDEFLSLGHMYQTEMRYYCRKLNAIEVPIHYVGSSSSLKVSSVTEALRILFELRKHERRVWND